MAAAIECKGGVAVSSVSVGVQFVLKSSCLSRAYGLHRAHGLGFQFLEFLDGMIGDLLGTMSGCRHDACILRESSLNHRLARLQLGQDFQYQVYGDAAYPILSHVSRGFRGANLTPVQKAYNRELLRVRISV
ncbi:unnamed protein product [Choristocarpus tenellus]